MGAACCIWVSAEPFAKALFETSAASLYCRLAVTPLASIARARLLIASAITSSPLNLMDTFIVFSFPLLFISILIFFKNLSIIEG